eukprot:tig00000042_g15612.t1
MGSVESPAAAEASPGGAAVENPFDRLPDELVQRIFSELEATEAYEKSQLWSIDRRFRRLVQGVNWKELRVDHELALLRQAVNRGGLDGIQLFTRLARRAIARLKSGALLGARRVGVGVGRGIHEHNIDAEDCSAYGNSDKCQAAAFAATKLLGALAISPAPPEEVELYWFEDTWPSIEDQLEYQLLYRYVPMSLEHLARSFLVALSPATTLRSLTWCFSPSLLAKAALLGAVPPLQRLKIPSGPLSREEVVAIREAWPVGPEGLSAMLRLRCLEQFSFEVDYRSAKAIGGLADLPELRRLSIMLSSKNAPDSGNSALTQPITLSLPSSLRRSRAAGQSSSRLLFAMSSCRAQM